MAKKQLLKDDLKSSDLGKRLRDWEKMHPHPDPFDDPKFNVNFGHWLQIPDWTAHEFVCLSLRKDPNKIPYDRVIKQHRHRESEVTFSAQYADRFQILARSLDLLSEHPYLTKKPKTSWVVWAAAKSWLPEELTDLAEQASDEKSALELDPRREKTYLRVIAALLDQILGKDHLGRPRPTARSELDLMRKLKERYPDTTGFSERNLRDIFSEARKNLSK